MPHFIHTVCFPNCGRCYITPGIPPTPVEDVNMKRGLSRVSTSLKDTSAVWDGDLPATRDVQVPEFLTRFDDGKNAIR